MTVSSESTVRAVARVTGIVQGVGFRPFLHRLARKHGLTGRVRNTTNGVEIEVEGPRERVEAFLQGLREERPPISLIEDVAVEWAPPAGYAAFEIVGSRESAPEQVFLSPDVAICADCARELLAPADRRYRYPFINCTNCGPRFSIIVRMPYDRVNTTMAKFEMCARCRAEYEDIEDRRYHAQPIACPVCGPRIWLVAPGGEELASGTEETIEAARRLIMEGGTVAVKGIGGFHLACDATNEAAVRRLRERKQREEKPFAVMCVDLAQAAALCTLSAEAKALMRGPRSPIVLAPKRPASAVAEAVAPGNPHLGVMVPYSPLHVLLLGAVGRPLVMTSGNLSDEPIAMENEEARGRLGKIADAFLLHDRDIHASSDDSVVRQWSGGWFMARRSRGYAPFPVRLPREVRPTLAVGAELKNVVCLARRRHAFLGEHIGDLENEPAYERFVASVERLRSQLMIEPEIVAYDLHPEYLSTKYALALEGVRLVAVQHHRAHVAACAAENGVEGLLVGVALDGLGYGDDGRFWGFEFFAGGVADLRRVAHARYLPMPGGGVVARQGWRMALAVLLDLLGLEKGLEAFERLRPAEVSAEDARLLAMAAERGVGAPLISSCGRLFDAAASLTGLRQRSSYEGQAPMELEWQAWRADTTEAYPYATAEGDPLLLDFRPTFEALLGDRARGESVPLMARKFHNAVIEVVVGTAARVCEEVGARQVALSGGSFQNLLLLEQVVRRLRGRGLTPLVHKEVPPNDGGLALGQVVLANAAVEAEREVA